MQYDTYKPSMRWPWWGLCLLAGLGFVGTFFIEAVYVCLLCFTGNLLLRVLLLLVALFLISLLLVFLIRIGRIRNLKVVRITVLCVLLFAFYGNRVIYVLMINDLWTLGYNEVISKGLMPLRLLGNWIKLFIRPWDVFAALFRILPIGTTSINGTMLKGGLLLFFWILEMLLFIVVPYIISTYLASRPYDEEKMIWYGRKREFVVGYVEGYRNIRAMLREKNYSSLESALESLSPYRLKGQESYSLLEMYFHGKKISPYVSLTNIKAVQAGPTRLSHRVIGICKRMDIGYEKAEALYSRMIDTSQPIEEEGTRSLRDKLETFRFRMNRRSKNMANELKVPSHPPAKEDTRRLFGDLEEVPGTEEVTIRIPKVTKEMEDAYRKKTVDK